YDRLPRLIFMNACYGRVVAGFGVKKPSKLIALSDRLRCWKSETQLATVDTISRAAAFLDVGFGSGFAGAACISPFFITLTFSIIAIPPCLLTRNLCPFC